MKDFLLALGYHCPKQMADGQWAALNRFIFTTGLLLGLDDTGYRTRFCYPTFESAASALEQWDGKGDPPGPWIKEKSLFTGDRDNPRTLAGIPIVVKKKTAQRRSA